VARSRVQHTETAGPSTALRSGSWTRESVRRISFSAHVRLGERGAPVCSFAKFAVAAGDHRRAPAAVVYFGRAVAGANGVVA
jgi:hypothetical protein